MLKISIVSPEYTAVKRYIKNFSVSRLYVHSPTISLLAPYLLGLRAPTLLSWTVVAKEGPHDTVFGRSQRRSTPDSRRGVCRRWKGSVPTRDLGGE